MRFCLFLTDKRWHYDSARGWETQTQHQLEEIDKTDDRNERDHNLSNRSDLDGCVQQFRFFHECRDGVAFRKSTVFNHKIGLWQGVGANLRFIHLLRIVVFWHPQIAGIAQEVWSMYAQLSEAS